MNSGLANPYYQLQGLLVMAIALLAACSQTTQQLDRPALLEAAHERAHAAHWVSRRLPTRDFILQSFHSAPRTCGNPLNCSPQQLTIFIEGDGRAWQTRTTPSPNPTPSHALGLSLALAHPQQPTAYLARPCQYLPLDNQPLCTPQTWTQQRFSDSAVRNLNDAIDSLKAIFKADNLHLVGYSGGGVLAALLAAQRHDVARLTTLAAPLDLIAWTTLHRVSAMPQALNPADLRPQLAAVDQLHLAGADDKVVPAALVRNFVAGFSEHSRAAGKVRFRQISGVDHQCCWAQLWPALIKEE